MTEWHFCPADEQGDAPDGYRTCKESGEEKVIVTALCGHGRLDLAAYENYLAGDVVDYEYPQERIDEALTRLPDPGP